MKQQFLRIITWNCKMVFRKIAEYILYWKPDILVVPECEHPDKLTFSKGVPASYDCFLFGANKNKGLGIFSCSRHKLKLLDEYNPKLKTILPLSVSGEKNSFTLLPCGPTTHKTVMAQSSHRFGKRFITMIIYFSHLKKHFSFGTYEGWCALSDHIPVMATFVA